MTSQSTISNTDSLAGIITGMERSALERWNNGDPAMTDGRSFRHTGRLHSQLLNDVRSV